VKAWKAARLAAALAVLAGAIVTSWLTALRTTWSERVEELAHRGLVRSVAERRAPREPAAVEVHRRLEQHLAALASEPGFVSSAGEVGAPPEPAAADARLRALVAAGGQDLAALDRFLAEPATAEVARALLPSATRSQDRRCELQRAAVLGLAAGAALSLDEDAPSRESARDCALRLGRALDLVRLLDDGCALSVVISGTLEADVLALVLRALDAGADPRALAAELEPRLRALSAPGRAERALRYDMDVFVSQVREASSRTTAASVVRSLVAEPFRYGEFHSLLDEYERCVAVARLAPGELLARAREGGMQPQAHPEQAPAYLRTVDSIELARARLALARAVLVLAAERAATGRWPADLADLPGALDPHSGEPLPYRVVEGRAILGPPAWTSGGAWTDQELRAALLLWERDA